MSENIAFWLIQIPGWCLFIYLVVSQCPAAISYELGDVGGQYITVAPEENYSICRSGLSMMFLVCTTTSSSLIAVADTGLTLNVPSVFFAITEKKVF